MVRRNGMHQEGSRYAGDEWVTEVAAAHRMASAEEESGTQGLKRGNCLNYGVYRHILQVGAELGRWARNRRGQLCLLCC